MCSYNRANDTINSIESIVKSLGENRLYIYDDGSNSNELLNFYKKITSYEKRVDVFLSYKNKGVEFANINRLENFSTIEDGYVYLTDNDVVLSSEFETALNSAYHLLKNNHNIFAVTLFNVEPNGCHNVISDSFNFGKYNFVYKRSFGGVSVLLKVGDFKKAMQFYQSNQYNGNFGWDWALCKYSEFVGKKLVATQNSYIQHIGFYGVNSSPDKFDKANNFII